MTERSILLFAGEASGDHHASAMIRELLKKRPDISVCGIGGDLLAEAGMKLLYHYRDVNTIGLGEGLARLRQIFSAYKTMKSELQSGRHELFIPVDYPDVNLRLCRFARDAGVKVCYYISPQVWAWRKGRIWKIARRVDHMMTIFPFEAELYLNAGIKSDFVGHTMVNELAEVTDRGQAKRDLGLDPDMPLVALVPGSRPAEIRRVLPVMAEAADMHARAFPGTVFAIPLAGSHLKGLVEEIMAGRSMQVKILSSDAARLMAAADCGLVTSGTATLQAALAEMPHAVVYILDAFTWWVASRILKPLVMDKDLHVAIANVLAINEEKHSRGPIKSMLDAGCEIKCLECGRPLFVPEILQDRATAPCLAEWLRRFTCEPTLRAAMTKGFHEIRSMLTLPPGSQSAAEIVSSHLP